MEKNLIPMFYPFVTNGQREAVNKTLQTRWIGQGPQVDEFEKKFSKKFNIPHCVSVNSGSAALETACDILGLQNGDKVISTPLTCTATNLPLARRKVQILWADIEEETLNISQKSIAGLLAKHPETKAVMNVHLGGIESNLAKLPVPVIDDAAQALGIYRNEASMTCYSFQAIKHITTGDGGMLCTSSEGQAKEAKLLRWFGIDREAKQKAGWNPIMNEREMTFDIELLGHKRQMTDIAAAMGIKGLEAYDSILNKRRQIFEIYRSIQAKGFKLIDPLGTKNVYWTAACLVENRSAFRQKLASYGIETNLVQVRNDIYKVFGGKVQDLPVMNKIDSKYIYIPLHNVMTLEDAETIKRVIEKGW